MIQAQALGSSHDNVEVIGAVPKLSAKTFSKLAEHAKEKKKEKNDEKSFFAKHKGWLIGGGIVTALGLGAFVLTRK